MQLTLYTVKYKITDFSGHQFIFNYYVINNDYRYSNGYHSNYSSLFELIKMYKLHFYVRDYKVLQLCSRYSRQSPVIVISILSECIRNQRNIQDKS